MPPLPAPTPSTPPVLDGLPSHMQALALDPVIERSSSPVAPLAGGSRGSASVSSPVRIPAVSQTGMAGGPKEKEKDQPPFLSKLTSGTPVVVPPPPTPSAGAASTFAKVTQLNTGTGLGKDGTPAPTDSITLGQLKSITAAMPKPKQTLYTFPAPPPDSSDLRSELEEFYSYVEIGQVLAHRKGFLEDWPHSTSFVTSSKPIQLEYITAKLHRLSSASPQDRFNAARILLHVAHGTFGSSTSPEHHLLLILSNCALLREAGALGPIWEAVHTASARWESVSGPSGSEETEGRREMEEANGELALLLAVLYFMVEVHRGDAIWADELMTLKPPMPIFLFNMVAGLREKNAKGYPVKKLLLILWKSILASFGGMKDLARVKSLVRTIEGLPPDQLDKPKVPRPETRVAPPDYASFRTEISSKYPSYVSRPMPSLPPLTLPDPDLLDRLASAAAPTPVHPSFSYLVNPNHEPGLQNPTPASGAPPPPPLQQPATPAPSPPPSPGPNPPKPKKQQFQTDQTKPFVLPFGPANSKLRAVPQSIEEAAELYRRNMRLSTELWQTLKLREEFIADETGVSRAERESKKDKSMPSEGRWADGGGSALLNGDGDEDQVEKDEEADSLTMLKKLGAEVEKELAGLDEEKGKERRRLDDKREDVKRLERVELLYRAVLPQMQSAVIVLLKLLLATVTANQALNGGTGAPDSGNEEVQDLTVEDVDIHRHREITSKAVSAILILSLKWFKSSHAMKFHYFSQLLVDSNCLLLILKMFGLQEVSTSIKTKNNRPDHNFFQFCYDAIHPADPASSPRPEDVLLMNRPAASPPSDGKTTTDGQASTQAADDDSVELITDFSWRNFFSTINFVHILQKLTKRKTHRILLLVQYKSSAILKRILKVSHPTLQLYVLKVIKSQVPYCGRKWRQSNMKVITAIYLHIRPDLRDEWLTGVDVDSDVEESLPHEQALRALVRFFNTKHYSTYAPLLHRRSSSANHGQPDFGVVHTSPGGNASNRPPSENDVFPPTRSVASFDADGNLTNSSPGWSAYVPEPADDLGDFEVDDLLSPQVDSDGEIDWDPVTSRAAWDRLGDLVGLYDDISDSESVGSLNFLGFRRDDGSDGSASDFDDEIDERQQRQDWEAISPETIGALEEERKASSPHSPHPRSRRSSSGPISPALRPVMIDREEDDSPVEMTQDGPAQTEPHVGPAVDEVEAVFRV